eukprot:gnl/TRDRNA2_/TRDRNA2_118177_c0_seq1.p1 gnl/TRDRNA2_/TRDRNA2_118177_c0~~gnl/TRDRNA2_/TRDRNA2_118177_c0_seq1.p1  ORF type:complete len:167 (-),score=19.37 gnl/TRDRNA2_/TRDRNA2_118177_c0_seq1:74-508(-)
MDDDGDDDEWGLSSTALAVLEVCQRNAFGVKQASQGVPADSDSDSGGHAVVDEAGGEPCKEFNKKSSFLFQTVCRFNHSCDPNARHKIYGDGRAVVCARRDIEIGEEITIAYVDLQQQREQRLTTLKDQYGFDCSCPHCLNCSS